MQKGDYLDSILRSKKTVFTSEDIALLWKNTSNNSTRVRLNYYVTNDDLHRIHHGIYAKDKNYDRLEFASRIYTPSYVSFETVLVKEGLIFQFQNSITLASYISRKIVIDGQKYVFRKIKNDLLTNTKGIMTKNNRSIASKERAFLDTLYNNADFYFDNIRSLDTDTLLDLLPIYKNKRLEKQIRELL